MLILVFLCLPRVCVCVEKLIAQYLGDRHSCPVDNRLSRAIDFFFFKTKDLIRQTTQDADRRTKTKIHKEGSVVFQITMVSGGEGYLV
jgi:hypothetical protein